MSGPTASGQSAPEGAAPQFEIEFMRPPEPSPVPESQPVPEPHPDLAPLAFLLGRWQGAGVGGYPTIESFRFGQELSFSHNGKPFLIYSSRTWLLDEEGRPGRPLGMEVGFWRPQPDNNVEFLLAHPTGFTEIYLGADHRHPDRAEHGRGDPYRIGQRSYRRTPVVRPGGR